MPELTAEKRERLRLHATQILETQRHTHQWHWTAGQSRDYATWMLEVLDALDAAEARLGRYE